MKLKATNEFIASFIQLQDYLSMVDRVTKKTICPMGTKPEYAVAVTAQMLQPYMKALKAIQEQRIEELKPIGDSRPTSDGGSEIVPKEGEKAAFEAINVKFNERWKELMEVEIDCEIHGFLLSNLPANFTLPSNLWSALRHLILPEPEPEKKG